MDNENEEHVASESFSARFGMVFGPAFEQAMTNKPIASEKLASSRVKRTLHQSRKQALVAGPEAHAELPIPASVVEKYRSPRAFMDEALKYLSPQEIGPAFAELSLSALKSKDVGLLKLLLPYVFGAPAKVEDSNQQSGALFGELLSVLNQPPIPNPSGKRGKQPKPIDIESFEVESSFHLPEEEEQEEPEDES